MKAVNFEALQLLENKVKVKNVVKQFRDLELGNN